MFTGCCSVAPKELMEDDELKIFQVQPVVRLISALPKESICTDIDKAYIAYRRCYSSDSYPKLLRSIAECTLAEKCEFVLNHANHESALEHVSFTFAIEGVSRAYSHQQVRHRMSNISQQSQRYTKVDELNVIMPVSISNNAEVNEVYLLTYMMILKAYNFALANNVPAEDARMILPNATETKLIVTFNIRSLMNFFNERLCSCAQWEIREVAERMRSICIELYPQLKPLFVPKCGKLKYCPESMSSWERCKRTPHMSMCEFGNKSLSENNRV